MSATASTPTSTRSARTAVMGVRAWPQKVAALWQRSLRFRTVLITLALTALTILVACVWMALSIQKSFWPSTLLARTFGA